MKKIDSICVYCGASGAVEGAYRTAATQLGETLGDNGVRLVYGGGRMGLMGLVADGCLSKGGKTLGFMPEHLDQIEGGHPGLDELQIVDSMHTRKMKMSENADAFVILPGGFGTLDELFEIMTWKQLKMHDSPIVVLNIQGYWDPFVTLFNHIIDQGFAKPHHRQLLHITDKVDQVLPLLKEAPDSKIPFHSELI